MSRRLSLAVFALCFAYALGAGFGHSAWAVPAATATKDFWTTDYASAMATAERQGKLLVIYFFDPAGSDLCRRFEAGALADPAIQTILRAAVALKVPLDARIQVQGKPVVLVEHPAYAALGRRPGVAVIDLTHQESRLNGQVVSCFPLKEGRQYTAADFGPRSSPAKPANAAQAVSLAQYVQAAPVAWLTDYADATAAAKRDAKMLLVFFTANDPRCTQFEAQTLSDPQIAAKLQGFVRVKLPVDTKIRGENQDIELIQHRAFAEMLGKPGLAILDFTHKDAPYYGCVVSTFPFLERFQYTPREMAVILDLPPGTLTQRTLIYAVRIHPERPASANGTLDPHLVSEAHGSADYQASIGRQGHHFWETRFHRINNLLPFGLLASEVCAESWPGEGLLQAAIECVRCWRTSPGHWGAVSQPHQVYGYDMKRGPNGIWYATGIFGKQQR
ncbi:MAG: thioredoxin family protein [Thermoguttaceae bacterium]